MSAIRAKNTQPEIILRKALFRAGFRGYRLNYRKVVGSPDICFPKNKIAIFVHGCFWHWCPRCQPTLPKTHSSFWKAKFTKNRARDKKKLALLQQDDWITLVFWECEIKKNLGRCIKKVARYF